MAWLNKLFRKRDLLILIVGLAINLWACAFTFIALGECVLPSVGNGCEWRNTLEWTFQTNGVPILCYRIYWEKDMQSNSDEWSRAVYTKVRRPSVLYHVITCDTNSVGKSCAELWYNIACQKLGVFTP